MARVDDLRDKHVLRLDRDQVRGLTLTKGDQKLVFEKRHDAERDIDDWLMTEPAARKVSDAVLSGLVYNLWNLKGDKVLSWAADDAEWEEAGLDKPELTVTASARVESPSPPCS